MVGWLWDGDMTYKYVCTFSFSLQHSLLLLQSDTKLNFIWTVPLGWTFPKIPIIFFAFSRTWRSFRPNANLSPVGPHSPVPSPDLTWPSPDQWPAYLTFRALFLLDIAGMVADWALRVEPQCPGARVLMCSRESALVEPTTLFFGGVSKISPGFWTRNCQPYAHTHTTHCVKLIKLTTNKTPLGSRRCQELFGNISEKEKKNMGRIDH